MARIASVFGLVLSVATGVHAEITVSIQQAPQRIAPQAQASVEWRITATDPVVASTLLVGSEPGVWTKVVPATQTSGLWRAQVRAPAEEGALHFTVFVRTQNESGTSELRRVEVGAADFGLTERFPVRLNLPRLGGPPRGLRLVRLFPQLEFTDPVALATPPADAERVVIARREGRLVLLKVGPNGATLGPPTTLLDIRNRVRTGAGEGLLGVAFPPDFGQSRVLYVAYTPVGGALRTVVSRFRMLDADRADPNGAEEVISIEQTRPGHLGGRLAFTDDGLLLIATGDGGQGGGAIGALEGDPDGNGQSRRTRLGKVLRVRPRVPGTFTIPTDNPFANATDGTRREIYATGVRSPAGLEIDPATGDLWIADRGELRQELSIVNRGANLGWKVFDGTQTYANPNAVAADQVEMPVFEYDPARGTSITGPAVASNPLKAPALRGAVLFGDQQSGRVFALRREDEELRWAREVAQLPSLALVGQVRGEPWLLDSAGRVHRLEQGTQDLPAQLSATGAFKDVASLTPAPGLIEYQVSSPLWSDGARKRRWIALPKGAQVSFLEGEPWAFPVGTVFVKHFELELRVGDPSSARRLETRMMVHHTDGWAGYTWKWNDQGTDATLLPGGSSEVYQVREQNGTVRAQTWPYPSRADCMTCHTRAAGFVLGANTEQLHRAFAYPNGQDDQLRAWNHVGMFDFDIGDPADYGSMPDPLGNAGDLSSRARSYLAANCSNCHRPGGGTPTDLDLTWGLDSSDMEILDVVPKRGDLGIAGARLVKPNDPARSILLQRMNRRNEHGMPLLGSNEVDRAGVELIRRWIQGGAQ